MLAPLVRNVGDQDYLRRDTSSEYPYTNNQGWGFFFFGIPLEIQNPKYGFLVIP